MINPQIKKITTFLLIIARVDRVAQVLARSACRPLGIDLAGEGASRCDRNGFATLVECVRGDTRPRCDSRRGLDGDDIRHSWGKRVVGALEERYELQVVQRHGTDAQDGTEWMKHRKGRGRERSEGLVDEGAFIPLPGRDVTQQQLLAQGQG